MQQHNLSVYEQFRASLASRIIYKPQSARPVTFRQATQHFPLRKECSRELLVQFLEEMNGGEAALTAIQTSQGVIWRACYANLELRYAEGVQ